MTSWLDSSFPRCHGWCTSIPCQSGTRFEEGVDVHVCLSSAAVIVIVITLGWSWVIGQIGAGRKGIQLGATNWMISSNKNKVFGQSAVSLISVSFQISSNYYSIVYSTFIKYRFPKFLHLEPFQSPKSEVHRRLVRGQRFSKKFCARGRKFHHHSLDAAAALSSTTVQLM